MAQLQSYLFNEENKTIFIICRPKAVCFYQTVPEAVHES